MAPVAGGVNGSSDDFLTGPGFADNQYRGTAWSNQPHALSDLLQGPAFTDQHAAPRFVAARRLSNAFGGALGICGHIKKASGVPVLENVEGAQPQEPDNFGRSGVRRVNHHGRAGLRMLQFFQEAGSGSAVGNREADQYGVAILSAKKV